MIVCICNKLKDKDFEGVVSGSCCMGADDVFSKLGCQKKCGKCVCFIEDTYLPKTKPNHLPTEQIYTN